MRGNDRAAGPLGQRLGAKHPEPSSALLRVPGKRRLAPLPDPQFDHLVGRLNLAMMTSSGVDLEEDEAALLQVLWVGVGVAGG